jgi:hypothetical protein
MIGVSRALKSHVSYTNNPPPHIPTYRWYVYTADKEHMWVEDWDMAMRIANQAAREYQIAYLREA